MRKRGFTLFETIVALAVFSLVMLIVFEAWHKFQKTSEKNDAKQGANYKTVRVYKDINKYLSCGSVRYFEHYNGADVDFGGESLKSKRWFAFLVSRNLEGIGGYQEKIDMSESINYSQKSNGDMSIAYNACMVYFLDYPGCCKGFNNCPHKTLMRKVFKTKENIYTGKTSYTFIKELRDNLQKQISDPAGATVVETEIVDLKTRQEDDRIKFNMTILRIPEAQRVFELGSEQLTSSDPDKEYEIKNEKVKKYVENLSWITVPGNT